MSITELEVQDRNDEQSEVLSWRLRELLRAGFSGEEAHELAARIDIDLHGAVDLVRKGCPHELAYRILV